MHIKQFRSRPIRVRDPLRPNRTTHEERITPTGATELSHDGEVYKADRHGWFDVPHEVGETLVKFRHPNGERFYTADEVDENVRIGVLEGDTNLPEPKADEKKEEHKKAPEKKAD